MIFNNSITNYIKKVKIEEDIIDLMNSVIV